MFKKYWQSALRRRQITAKGGFLDDWENSSTGEHLEHEKTFASFFGARLNFGDIKLISKRQDSGHWLLSNVLRVEW